MLHVATFLAIGPQIYVDGLVVLDNNRVAGRIGGLALARYILKAKERWLEAKADDIMDPLDRPLDAGEPLAGVLDMFEKTRFAFMPVALESTVVASLSMRDLLGAVTSNVPVYDLASPLISSDRNIHVSDALEFMVEKGLRNLVIMQKDEPCVINDRKILEYLLSHEARELILHKGFGGLSSVSVKSLDLTKGRKVDPSTTAEAAARLYDINTPCLFADNKILSPWDLVMKTLK